MYFRRIYDERKYWREGQVEGRGSCKLLEMKRGAGRVRVTGEGSEGNYNLPNSIYDMCGTLAR